jgi:hypothetical protein
LSHVPSPLQILIVELQFIHKAYFQAPTGPELKPLRSTKKNPLPPQNSEIYFLVEVLGIKYQ